MAKLIRRAVLRNQGTPSQVDSGSSGPSPAQRTCDWTAWPSRRESGLRVLGITRGCTVRQTPPRLRIALVMVITLLMCLMLILLPTYANVASAQERTSEERLVEGMVANLNAYWEEQFRLLGHPYSPATLLFLYDHQLVFGPCGLAIAELGPGYCPYDETLYYPIGWVDPATGLRLEEYGESAVEMVVAHEMAHHIQVQMEKLGIQGTEAAPGTQMELEADCLAGVYANQGITEPGGIEAALTALGDAGGPGHGSSEQRVAAFELGYTTGDPAQCLALGDGGGATNEGSDGGIM